MAGCCGPKCSKAFVILYNLLFWISGCAFVALGVVLLYDKSYSYLYILLSQNVDKYPREIIDYIAYGSIGAGGLILFVGFFGCCGALQESKCMIGTYIFFLIIICFVEAALGLGTLYCWWTFPSDNMKTQLKSKWSSNYTFNQDFTEAFNHAQATMKCCGIDGDADYTTKTSQFGGSQFQYGSDNYGQNQYNTQTGTNFGQGNQGNRFNAKNNGNFNQNTTYPYTCCVLQKKWQDVPIWKEPKPENLNECQAQQNTPPGQQSIMLGGKQARYNKGCFDEIMKWYWLYLIIIGSSSGGLALLQIAGVLFSLCLIRNIGEEA